MPDPINDLFATLGKRFLRDALEGENDPTQEPETNGITERLEKIEAAITNLITTQQKHHFRLTEVEDCITAPENGDTPVATPDDPDPRDVMWQMLYNQTGRHISSKQGVTLEETQRKMFASRCLNKLWSAGYKTPDRTRTLSDKRMKRLFRGGDGFRLVRATFPRIS